MPVRLNPQSKKRGANATKQKSKPRFVLKRIRLGRLSVKRLSAEPQKKKLGAERKKKNAAKRRKTLPAGFRA